MNRNMRDGPNCDGLWVHNDNDGTWGFVGKTVEALHITMKELAEDDWASHDVTLYLCHGAKKWDICDGCNPLDAKRLPRLEKFIKDNF